MRAQSHFATVPQAEIQRSRFDRSHGLKTTFDAGLLVPVFLDEVLPGDTFNLSMAAFCRFATPIKPIMDNVYLDSFFFFVPSRLVWDNWEKFNGAQDAPGDSTDYVIPTIANATIFTTNQLGDYFGLPTGKTLTGVSALPFRCYNLIFNEWFRDENLVSPRPFVTGDGPDNPVTNQYISLASRGKRHDYFTSSLPWPQKGPAVTLPLGSTAPIVPNTNLSTGAYEAGYWTKAGTPTTFLATGAAEVSSGRFRSGGAIDNGWWNPARSLVADLSTATAATINSLREAFQLQRLFERDARGGTRYIEILKAHFGVTSPDARLQRPEYLGGGSTPLNVNPIAQTNSTDTTTPQGNLAAMGTVSVRNNGFSRSFVEHGYIIGLVSARADLTYQQGLNRLWSRKTRFDFYWPALAHLGEQAVLNKEIYYQGAAADDQVFGYQERYAEYRYKPSQLTSIMRSNVSVGFNSLDVWHVAQNFASLPALNSTFISENPPIDRVIAVPSEPHFIGDFYFNLKCARPMPVYSVPGLIDHF